MFVDATAMTERDDSDNKDILVDSVDDQVVPDANPEAGPPSEGFRAWRPWILTEERDCTTNAVAILMVNLLQRANCGRTQFDLVNHVQPRSAFT